MQFHPAKASIEPLILSTFEGKICQHSPISLMVKEHPIELAYALAVVPRATIIPSLRRSCDAQNGIAKILLFFIHATLFRFFHFHFLLIIRKIIFQTTRFQPFFRPFSGVFPENRPLFGSPFRSFSQKHGIFRRKLTPSPPSLALELVEGARGRGGRYGRTPQAMPQKRKWNEFIQSRNTTKTQLYFTYIFTKKFHSHFMRVKSCIFAALKRESS